MSVDSERRPLIAHIIYTLSTGGMENGLVNIINRMPAGKYRHLIICLTEADSFAKRITADNVEIIELHMREGHDFDCYRRLRKCLKQLRPDIVHSRNIAALEAQLFTLGLSGLKRVHGEHGREIFDLDGSNWKYLALRKFMRLFIDRYIAVSRDLEQWLTASVGVSPGRLLQIYNGVDHERFAPDAAKPLALLPNSWRALDGMLIAGTVGRLTPVKDQQILLRAVASLRGKHPELARRLRVILVGDGPLRTDIERLSAQLGLQEVVWLTGDRADVPELLKLMDVFLLPSLGEGISNTVLEAMASGCPIIATAVGGNVELVDNGSTGALVPVGDQGALEHAMLTLLSDEQDRREQGLNARQEVCRDFDWEHTVASY
ncbi:MAG: TIGR03088 family PEP-CTERM/XrtA system glycosyltransferase, partial [Halieaceae bacterium]|nr:TIGR03088 family PEP-CTERM/XrtA system glycosyltransferase [Halieaceae bacterium]